MSIAKVLDLPNASTASRFGGPRDVHESFMDVPRDESAEPSMLQPPRMIRCGLSRDIHGRISAPRKGEGWSVSANSLIPGWSLDEKSVVAVEKSIKIEKEPPVKAEVETPVKVGTDSPVTSKPLIEKQNFEYDPDDLATILDLSNGPNVFAPPLSHSDPAVCKKASPIQKRADDYLDEGDDINREPATTTKDELSILQDINATKSNDGDLSKLHLHSSHTSPPAPIIKIEMNTADDAERAIGAFEDIDPVFASFPFENSKAFGKARSDSYQMPPSVSAINVENAASGTQSSVSSFNSCGFKSSPPDIKQDLQDTPDTTYLDQSQQTFGRSQSPFSQTQGLPNSFSQGRFGSQSFLSPPGSVISQTSGPVEINPRRSARLAQSKTPAPGSSAPSAPASQVPPPSLMISSSVPALGVKRRRSTSLPDEIEQVERQGRNKKVVTKEVVAKQREARHNEDVKDKKRSSLQRRTSVLQRRSV